MTMQSDAKTPDTSSPRVFEDGRGGRITILEEGSATTPMRYRMILTKGFGPPPERHPNQREDFRVLSGTLDLGIVNGKHVELRVGDTFTLPPATFHRPGNLYDEPAEFEAVLTPGLESARMFASIYSTVRAHRGIGMILSMAFIMDRHRREIEFPLPVRVPLQLLGAFAKLTRIRIE